MLAGTSDEQKADLFLDPDPRVYHYINQSSCYERRDGVMDSDLWAELNKAMKVRRGDGRCGGGGAVVQTYDVWDLFLMRNVIGIRVKEIRHRCCAAVAYSMAQQVVASLLRVFCIGLCCWCVRMLSPHLLWTPVYKHISEE